MERKLAPGNISSILGSKESASTGTTQENPFVEASQLIGQKIQYNSGENVIQAIIEAITTNSNGSIEYILNNGSRLTKEQFTLVSENQSLKKIMKKNKRTRRVR